MSECVCVMRACSWLKRKMNKLRDLSELVLHHFSRQCNAMLYVVPLDPLLDSTQLDLLSHQVGVGVAGAVANLLFTVLLTEHTTQTSPIYYLDVFVSGN